MNIKELDVFSLLIKLDIGESTVSSEMHPRLLEKLASFTADTPSICFNVSISQCQLAKDYQLSHRIINKRNPSHADVMQVLSVDAFKREANLVRDVPCQDY